MKNIPFYSSNKALLLSIFITALLVPNILTQTLLTKEQNLFNRSAPIIIAEKGNYQVDEIAQIFGMNFQSYERVRLNIKYINNSLRQEIPITSFDVYSDKRGYMSAEWKVLDVDQPGTTFIVLAKGTSSGITTKAEFSTKLFAGEAVDIDQCSNTDVTPQTLECPNVPSAGWVNGNVNANKAAYFEGDSIAYRAKFSGLTAGNSYTFQIGYDTAESSINTIDYLTTYNRTITNANPCRDGASPSVFCTAGAPDDTIAIPIDPIVTNGRDLLNGTLDDITQAPGDFSIWDGDLTGVSGYTYDPGFPIGNIETSVSVTFTATGATAVIAWGGHISTRSDWGELFGSVNRTGSPYHTRNEGLTNNTDTTTCCTGQQELQLAVGAITPTAKIVIIKHASPPSNLQFDFSATNLNPSNFSLVDNSSVTDPRQTFDNITDFNIKTITETNRGPYTLRSIDCTVDVGTGGTPTPIRTGDSIAIDIRSGDQVTCTFNNDFVTAADVSVSGKVIHPSGYGLKRAQVTMIDGQGNLRTAMTNQFGYFKFSDVAAGETYLFETRHKSYIFAPQLIDVNDNLSNLVFSPLK